MGSASAKEADGNTLATVLPLHIVHALCRYQACLRTDNDGKWQGAKVQELVDALEGENGPAGKGKGGESDKALFVTKHEVLRLKKAMATRPAHD